MTWDYLHTCLTTALQEEYGVRVIEDATVEPVTLAEARSHLRLTTTGTPPDDTHPDDTMLSTIYIPAAREWCEFYQGRTLATQTLEYSLDRFTSSRIVLPLGPIQSVDAITYLDAAGAEQTLTVDTDYVVTLYGGRAAISLPDGVSWPTTYTYKQGERAVFIQYVAGYSVDTANDFPIPRRTKAAILLMLGHLYENREETSEKKLEQIVLGAQALLDGERLRLGFA